MITAAQVRAARALIGWTQTDLAKAASISEMSVKNVERGDTDPRYSTLRSIMEALAEAGVVFLPENGSGAGVRLFKEPLQGWLECRSPYPGDFGVQNAFEQLFMAAAGPAEAALFCRTSRDRKDEVFLLSAGASRFSAALPGNWGPAANPSLYGWTLLVGHSDARERLGLPGPKMGSR
jgi:transcriptional regulator with XRE-family HTH domain